MTEIITTYILPSIASIITLVWGYRTAVPAIIEWFQTIRHKQKETNVLTDSHKLTMHQGMNHFHENQLQWAFTQLDVMEKKCKRNQEELEEIQKQCALLRETLNDMHIRLLEAKNTVVRFAQFTCGNALTCSNHCPLHKKDKTDFEIEVPDIKELLKPAKKNEVE